MKNPPNMRVGALKSGATLVAVSIVLKVADKK
jgi:hypothetical protein